MHVPGIKCGQVITYMWLLSYIFKRIEAEGAHSRVRSAFITFAACTWGLHSHCHHVACELSPVQSVCRRCSQSVDRSVGQTFVR